MDDSGGLLERIRRGVRLVLDGGACSAGEDEPAAFELPEFRWEPPVSDWFRCGVCRTLPESMKAQVDRLESDAFGAGAGKKPKKLERVSEQFCSEPAGYVLGIAGEDRVVGSILLFRRAIRFRGRRVVLGGVGGVTTDRRLRGRGVASALMGRTMAVLGELGCEVALLCTDLEDERLTRLYGRFGFEPLGRPYSYDGRSGRLYVNDDGMLAPVLSVEKFRLLKDSAPNLYIGTGNF